MQFWTTLTWREGLASGAIVLIVLACWVGLHYSPIYLDWRRWRIARRITTPLGNVKVTIKDIQRWNWRSCPEIVKNDLPEHIQVVLRRQTAADLGRISVELIDPEKARTSYELKRALTLAAALYDFQLPWRLLLLDDVTAAYLRCAQYDLQPVYVDASSLEKVQDFHVVGSITLTNLGISRYTSQLGLIAGVLIVLANNSHYPAVKSFVKIFNHNLKKGLKNSFTEDEIRSMATAYAVLTHSRIPRSYILLDAVTKAIIDNPLPSKRPVPKEILQ